VPLELHNSSVRKRNLEDSNSTISVEKRARLHDSAISSNPEESDTSHYEDKDIFEDYSLPLFEKIRQEKGYDIHEASENNHAAFPESLIVRDATSETSEVDSSFHYGSSSWEGSSSEKGLAEESDVLGPDVLSLSEESTGSEY
jgi:hypothetical protein